MRHGGCESFQAHPAVERSGISLSDETRDHGRTVVRSGEPGKNPDLRLAAETSLILRSKETESAGSRAGAGAELISSGTAEKSSRRQ